MPGGGVSQVPGTVPRWGKGAKKVYDKSEAALKADRFELGKSEKIAEI